MKRSARTRLGALLCITLVLILSSAWAAEDASPEGEDPLSVPDHSTSITILNPLDGLLADSGDDSGFVQAVAFSDGTFGIIVNPSFSLGPFSTRLNLTLKGSFEFDPFNLDFDFSDWSVPERGEDESNWQYGIKVAAHYSRFIQTFQFGNPYDPLFFRYGKLLGPTLGDGALISGYVDRTVGILSSKPGINMMIDAQSITKVPSGFHLLVDNVFEPTMNAWRIYSTPFAHERYLSTLQLGLSYATGLRTLEEEEIRRHFFGLDFALPLVDTKIIKADVFTDFLFQGFDVSAPEIGLGIRSGIHGRLGSLFTYNASITAPLYGQYWASFFTNEWAVSSAQQLILPFGSSRFEGALSFTWPKQEVFFGAKIASDLINGSFENNRMFANLRFDHLIFNLLSLDLRYEKLYSTTKGEGFFEGLTTLRSVDIQVLALIKVKPYVISLGATFAYDEHARLTSTIDAVVRVVLL
ncbi:MAG: hypothetical protein WC954_02245 [Sphaerochaeta sp.]